jgi:hypothetical protein
MFDAPSRSPTKANLQKTTRRTGRKKKEPPRATGREHRRARREKNLALGYPLDLLPTDPFTTTTNTTTSIDTCRPFCLEVSHLIHIFLVEDLPNILSLPLLLLSLSRSLSLCLSYNLVLVLAVPRLSSILTRSSVRKARGMRTRRDRQTLEG